MNNSIKQSSQLSFEQLNERQQEQAVKHFLSILVKFVVEGQVVFNDALNKDKLQSRINKAIEKAEKNQTPWFGHEYLMEDSYIVERLESMARCDAEDSIYCLNSEKGLCVVNTTLSKVSST